MLDNASLPICTKQRHFKISNYKKPPHKERFGGMTPNYLRFLPPCTALKRGLDLQMTKVRPRRRTTWQSSWRVLADLSDDSTCMILSCQSWDK